jgi:uncharacterized protein (TIGR02217 family)
MFECEFPTEVGFLASGGPTFNTTVNEGFSGGEQRNRNWSTTRGEWSINLNYKDQSYFDQAHAFFLVVGGQFDSFRFKDHKDFRVENQLIGTGDGSNPTFQLVRTYTSGDRAYTRIIRKPITSSVKKFDGSYCEDTVNIYVAASLQTEGVDYNLDETTGIVTFIAGHIPTMGQVVSADFEYHYPVRFLNDKLKAQVEESAVNGGNASDSDPRITWPQIELREVKVS